MENDTLHELLLSIIIPVWNRSREIVHTIRSIASQLTEHSVEIIIVDDASLDDIVFTVKQLEKNYSYIRFLRTFKHSGAAAARNKGLDEAKGRYIWFVDADDLVADGALPIIIRELEKGEADILRFNRVKMSVRPKTYHMDASWNIEARRVDIESTPAAFYAFLCWGSVWNAIFSRTLIGATRFDEFFAFGEDAPFSWELALRAKSCFFIDAPLYVYMNTIGSMTWHKTTERFQCYLQQVEKMRYLIDRSDLREDWKEVLRTSCRDRVFTHVFFCFSWSEINSEMWNIWFTFYRRFFIEDPMRSAPKRFLSRLLFISKSRMAVYTVFILCHAKLLISGKVHLPQKTVSEVL